MASRFATKGGEEYAIQVGQPAWIHAEGIEDKSSAKAMACPNGAKKTAPEKGKHEYENNLPDL